MNDPLGLFDDEPVAVNADPLGLFEEDTPLADASQIPGVHAEVPRPPERSVGEKSLGLLEQIPVLASSMAAQFSAPVSAGIKMMTGMNDQPTLDAQMGADMAAKTYEPRSAAGQDYAKGTGEFMNRYITPLTGFVRMPNRGVSQGQLAMAQRDMKAPAGKLQSLEAKLAEKKAAAVQQAADIPRVEVRGTRDSPPTTENPVITVTPEGEAIPPNVDLGTMLARERATEVVQKSLDDTLPLENQTSLEAPDGQMSMFDQADLMGQRNQYNAGNLGDWRMDENGMQVRADLSMEASNLEAPVQRNLWGDELGPALGNELSLTDAIDSMPRGPERASAMERFAEPAREAVKEQHAELQAYQPGKVRRNKQSGHILIPGSKAREVEMLKRVPGIKESFKNFLPDSLTPDEFLERHKGGPDLDQNVVQRQFNYWTKGGDYMVEKTNNPLIKRAVDAMKGADGRAKGNIQRIVHDNYARKLRGMKRAEYDETWAALKSMERDGLNLTPDELKESGFTQKQRDMIATHQTVMQDLIPRIEKAMSDAGMGTFHRETAYVASKATGQFRSVMYKKGADGELTPAGVLGANTRMGLNKQIKQYSELYPDTSPGPELTFMGGKGKMAEGFEDMLRLLSDNDATVREFVQRANEMMNSDVQNFKGAKTHTMRKKGVEGMAGNKPWENASTNAKEGFDAQVAYLNRMLEFAEKAAAVAELKPLLAPDNGLNMPKAKQYAKDYIDMALGRNPMKVGRAVDKLFQDLGDASGLGTAGVGKIGNAARQYINTKLLALDPVFLLANSVEILRSTPEMAAYLRTKGIKTGPTGLSHNYTALMDMAKEGAGMKLGSLIDGALKYADENHVYASDLFEKSNDTRHGIGQVIMDGMQKPAASIEHLTRKNAFLGFVHMLDDNGLTVKDGIYEAAAKLTDMSMNSYSTMESPMALQNLGSASKAPYNLLSYKFNQLSRFSMMAREVKKGNFAPVLTALAMQAAFSGLMGMMTYKEADFIVRKINEWRGEPKSLTQMLLESDTNIELPMGLEVDAAYGGFSAAGGDMTNRLGSGYIAGDLSQPLDMMMPGAGALVDAGAAAVELIKDPSEFNAKRAIVDILPGGKVLDPWFFEKKTEDGRVLASSRSKAGLATAERNIADQWWKKAGGTGMNEAKQKTMKFEQDRVDKFYMDKQKTAVERMKQSFYTDGKFNQKYINDFIKAEGNPETFNTLIERVAMEQNIPAPDLAKLKLAGQSTIPAGRKMQRRFQ